MAKDWPLLLCDGILHAHKFFRHIYDFLESVGCDVVSWHVVDLDSDEEEADMSEHEIYLRDLGLLEESDCMVAEVTVPSIGVGYEVCRALGLGLPVLCVHSAGANVSAMVLGNPNLQGRVMEYASLDDLEQILYEFAGALGDSND